MKPYPHKIRQRILVRSDTDVMHAVLASKKMASDLGFDETQSQMIATAVSELARNILKYATRGDVFLNSVQEKTRQGIEITVRDEGPGIDDIEEALNEHFSSSGTLGLGLPGVKRMMDEMHIDSTLGRGTKIVIRKWHRDRTMTGSLGQ